ncbi:MAG: copper amine oxidase domain protein [Proteobacteria bacterium]|nr:copper amine oxidase domain protein [Pseudomonadota bacterium]
MMIKFSDFPLVARAAKAFGAALCVSLVLPLPAQAADLPAETFGPLPRQRIGVVRDGRLHCLEAADSGWRRCRSWQALALPNDARRVLGNEHVIAVVRDQQIDFYDEEAKSSRVDPLALESGWRVQDMVNGEYSTEPGATLRADGQLKARLTADPDSNVTLPLDCPQAEGRRVFGLLGARLWALVGPTDLRVVRLQVEAEPRRMVCVSLPEGDWSAPAGTDEISVYALDFLAVRSGATIRFLSRDKSSHSWQAARQSNWDGSKGEPIADLNLDAVLAQPVRTIRPVSEPPPVDDKAMDALVAGLVPKSYAWAERLGQRFVLVAQAPQGAEGERLFGVLDEHGREILAPVYAAVEHHEQTGRFKVARRVGDALRWGFTDEQGKVVVPLEYDAMERISNNGDEPTVVVRKGERWGYLDFATPQVLIEPAYDHLAVDSVLTDGYGEGVLKAERQGKWAVLDTDGQALTDFVFDRLEGRADGYIGTQDGQGKWLRVQGKRIVETGLLPPPPGPGGVGMGLDFPEAGVVVVREVIPGSPAVKARIQVGDRILQVDDQQVTKLNPQQTIAAIRGALGSVVRLVIQRGERRLTFKVKRADLSAR